MAPRRATGQSVLPRTPALPQLLTQLWRSGEHLLATPGRALEAVKRALPERQEAPQWSALHFFDHGGFDHMLWACDLNFVRDARRRLLSRPDLLTTLLAATNQAA